METKLTDFRIYEVEARTSALTDVGVWLTVRVIAKDGELALAAAKPIAAEALQLDESKISVRCSTPAYKVDALVGLIEPEDPFVRELSEALDES